MIVPVQEKDFDSLGDLARRIWFAHYAAFVSAEQLHYMLATRFTADNLRTYLNAKDRWLEVLHVDGQLAGYCSYALTATPGEMKLEQLYLLPALHGQGFGGEMMRHIQQRAEACGCQTLILQVNKQNERSIAIYRKAGFTVRKAAQFDIGNGFVMDDYVMEKQLR